MWSRGLDYKLYNFIVWDSGSYELSPIVANVDGVAIVATATGNAFLYAYYVLLLRNCVSLNVVVRFLFIGD